MNKLKIFFYIILIPFGIFMFMYGEYDDSPGGQLLGVVAMVVAIVGLFGIKKK